MSGAAMDNPVSSINVKVSLTILDNNQWSYQAYPWTIHEWPNDYSLTLTIHGSTLPGLLCLSIRGCQSYCAIHGPSVDWHPACSLLSIHGPSIDGHLATPPCPSIRACHSYWVHPWTINGWTPCLPPFVQVSMDVTVTVSIHGPSMDGHLASCLPSV